MQSPPLQFASAGGAGQRKVDFAHRLTLGQPAYHGIVGVVGRSTNRPNDLWVRMILMRAVPSPTGTTENSPAIHRWEQNEARLLRYAGSAFTQDRASAVAASSTRARSFLWNGFAR